MVEDLLSSSVERYQFQMQLKLMDTKQKSILIHHRRFFIGDYNKEKDQKKSKYSLFK